MDKVIVIGFFSETVELCEKCGCAVSGVIDSRKIESDYKYLGNDEQFADIYKDYMDIPLVITPDKPSVREKLYRYYSKLGFSFKTLIAPDAVVSKSAVISEGCMIQSGCNVSAGSVLGRCVRVNTHANIMHDANVGDFSTVAPDAVLLGYTEIGTRAYIGANSTVLPNIKIGDDAVIGAGAVVTKNVGNNITAAGVPARRLGSG